MKAGRSLRTSDSHGPALATLRHLPAWIAFTAYLLIIVIGFAWFWQDVVFSDRGNASGTSVDPAVLDVGQEVTVNRMRYHEGWSLTTGTKQQKPTITGLTVTNEHSPGLFLPGDRDVLVDVYFYRGDALVYEILCESPGRVAAGATVQLTCNPYLYDWTPEYERIEFVQVNQQ